MQMKKTLVPPYIADIVTYKAGKPIDELMREKNLTRVTKLASNENPLGPSPKALKQITSGLWDIHRYPDSSAYKLKAKLCELYDLKPENITLGNGSEGIMGHIARAFIQPHDEILTSEQTFMTFYILAKGSGAKLTKVPLTSDYRYDVKALANAITEKTKIVYIANPNNPSGTYISRKEFDFLMEHVPDHCLVILDEAYFEFAAECSDYPNSMDYRYDNVITLRTFSKAYGISGIRVGYAFGHEDLIGNLAKVKMPFEPNLLGQLAAWGALDDKYHLEDTLKNNKKRYDETWKCLTKHGFKPIPSVTNFIAFPVGSLEAEQWLNEALLNEGVILRGLSHNEMPGFLRVSLGKRKEMEHFFEAMDKVMPEFNKRYQLS